jgi:hypothetical protein
MDASTTLANTLLQRALGSAAVESFGFAHQVPYLEFRDEQAQDHVLTFDTTVSSNVVFADALGLTEAEKLLLLFNRVNLRLVTFVACDEQANLVLAFDNGVQLRCAGNPADVSEPWQVGSRAAVETGGYLVIATHGGGYAIWDNTPTRYH